MVRFDSPTPIPARTNRRLSTHPFGTPEPIFGVLFDANGVIYHRPHRNRRLNRVLAPHGLGVLPVDETRELIAAERDAAQVGQLSTEEYYRAKLRAYGLEGEELLAEGVRVMMEDSADIELFEGTVEGLSWLHERDVRLAIVTDSAKPAETKLGWLVNRGLPGHIFSAVISSMEVGACKPEPYIYEMALWRLGLEPKNAAFVGHATDELLGAAAVGLTTIAFRPDDPEVDADAHIEDLRELDDLLP